MVQGTLFGLEGRGVLNIATAVFRKRQRAGPDKASGRKTPDRSGVSGEWDPHDSPSLRSARPHHRQEGTMLNRFSQDDRAHLTLPCHPLLISRHANGKTGSLSQYALTPDTAAYFFDQLLGNRQSIP